MDVFGTDLDPWGGAYYTGWDNGDLSVQISGVTVDGETMRAMTAYSFFGKAEVPEGFLVALLGEDRSEFLVFRDGEASWIEYGDQRYDACD